MHKFFGKSICTVILCVPVIQNTAAEEKLFNATASVREIHDSNFSRTPDPEPENITLSAAGIGFDERLGRQRFLGGWQISHYEHDELHDFDATLNEGKLSWNGQFGSELNGEIIGVRDAHLSDQWEFFEKDIVNKDDLKGKLGLGNDESRLTFHVGGRHTHQTHSNSILEILDFNEEEAFVDAGYQTANKSKLEFRVRSGNRAYLETNSESLDFDYRQFELESLWQISQKTGISATFARVERTGEINDGSGQLATITMQWEATPKVRLEGGYSLSQPAVGETLDTPSKVQTYFAAAHWQLTSKIAIGSRGSYVKRNYEPANEFDRVETLTVLAPLAINYEPYEFLSILLETGWRNNQSTNISREYTSSQSTLGIVFRY